MGGLQAKETQPSQGQSQQKMFCNSSNFSVGDGATFNSINGDMHVHNTIDTDTLRQVIREELAAKQAAAASGNTTANAGCGSPNRRPQIIFLVLRRYPRFAPVGPGVAILNMFLSYDSHHESYTINRFLPGDIDTLFTDAQGSPNVLVFGYSGNGDPSNLTRVHKGDVFWDHDHGEALALVIVLDDL
ncbi:hypothetical protein MD484_g597, partial [Candolleomyces efflorescens]